MRFSLGYFKPRFPFLDMLEQQRLYAIYRETNYIAWELFEIGPMPFFSMPKQMSTELFFRRNVQSVMYQT